MKIILRMLIFTLNISLFISCINSTEATKSGNKNQITDSAESSETEVIGLLVAFGNDPHITWMIQDMDGKLYLPFGKLQSEVSELPSRTYVWIGKLERPENTLPGLIPPHAGVFKVLRWELVEE